MVDCNLLRWIADYDIPLNRVALNPSRQKDPIRVTEDEVVFDCVVRIGRSDEANTKIVALSCISISTDPVRTEPVMACARGQSYAAARSAGTAIVHGNVPGELIERASDDDNP